MWIKYNRVLEGNQWRHPDFANDGRTLEKYLHPEDKTLFLAETTITDISGYEKFNIVEITDVKTAKQDFEIGVFISKYKFIERFTDIEWAKIVGFQMIIDASSLTEQEKFERKLTMNALLKKLELSNEINLLDKKAESMGAILVDYDFVTQDRIKEILAI